MLGLLETAKNKEKDRMVSKFRFFLLVAVLIAYGSLPYFRNDVSVRGALSGLGIALVGIALVVGSIWLYHRKPVWEYRTAANAQPFLELVSVWELRERMMRRFSMICLGGGIGILIATLLERAPT